MRGKEEAEDFPVFSYAPMTLHLESAQETAQPPQSSDIVTAWIQGAGDGSMEQVYDSRFTS